MIESRAVHLAAVLCGGDDAINAGEQSGEPFGIPGSVAVVIGQDYLFGNSDAVGAQEVSKVAGVADAGEGKRVFARETFDSSRGGSVKGAEPLDGVAGGKKWSARSLSG